MNRATRELIGRATMLVVAAALLAGAVGLGKTAHWLDQEEKRTAERMRHSGARQTRIALCVWVASGLVGIGGIAFLLLGVGPHRHLDRHPPKPPVLWDNHDNRL